MSNYGTYLRVVPRMRVVRGYPGNEPTNISRSAPITANVVIYSGQIISLSSGAWVLGCTSGSGVEPFVAFHDSTDPDVIQSGVLLGFSCSGNYTFETGWFTAAAGSYNADNLPLAADNASSSLVQPVSGAGCLKLTSISGGLDIIGFTANGGLQNVTTTNSEATPYGTPAVVNLLTFTAKWLPIHS